MTGTLKKKNRTQKDPALEKLFNTPIKITNQRKRIFRASPNFEYNNL